MELPEGLTTRPLVLTDAPAVTAVMAAEELADIGEVAIEEADIVGDWQRPSFDLATSTIGVFDGDRLVGYAERSGARPRRRSRRPRAPRPGDRHLPRRLAAGHRPRRRRRGDRDAGAAGLPGRPAAHRPRLPGPLDLVGARAASRGGDPGPPAARGVRRTRGRAGRARGGVDGDRGRVPRVVRPATAVVRGLHRRGDGPARLRALEPPRGHRPRTAPSSARRSWCWPRAAASSTGSRCARTSASRGLATALLVDSFAAARANGAERSELSTDSRTGALGLYENVGMQVTSTWVNRAVGL